MGNVLPKQRIKIEENEDKSFQLFYPKQLSFQESDYGNFNPF